MSRLNALCKAQAPNGGGASEDRSGYSPAAVEVKSKGLVGMLALLNAKGVSTLEVSELCGLPLDALEFLSSEEGFSQKVMELSVKLNLPLDTRLANASNIAAARMLRILSDPESSNKDVISAAKDVLDRHMGKAMQKVSISSTSVSLETSFEELQRSIKAADDRVAGLLDLRAKLLNNASATPAAAIVDV